MKLNIWWNGPEIQRVLLAPLSPHYMHSTQKSWISFPVPHIGTWRRMLVSATILGLFRGHMSSARLKLSPAQTWLSVPRTSPILEAEEEKWQKCGRYCSHNFSWCPASPIHTACTTVPFSGTFKTTLCTAWLIRYETTLMYIDVSKFCFSLPLSSLLPCLLRYWTIRSTWIPVHF